MSGRRRRWRADQNDFHSVCFCRFWNHSSGLRAVRSNNKSMTIWFKKEIIFNFMSHERAEAKRFRFAIPLSISTWDFSLGSAVAVCMANGQNSNQLKRKSTERWSGCQECSHLLSILFAWLVLIRLFIQWMDKIAWYLHFFSSTQAINTCRLA